MYSDKLTRNARVLISFVASTSRKSLTLRVRHSGEDAPLEVTLGSTTTKIQLNSSYKSSLTIDEMILYSIEVSDPSKSDRLSFEPEVRNDIFFRFIATVQHSHYLHDIALLDEDGLEYMPRSLN